MKTVVEVLQLSAVYLEERKIDRARRLAEELLAHILKMKRIDLYLQHDRPLEEGELIQLREGLRRLAKGEPIAYVLGEVSFYGCIIRVDRRVLIPRPETELLVEHVLKNRNVDIVWDLCTGSGAIAIALKKSSPDLKVSASDICSEALVLATENAFLNETSVEFLCGDLFSPFVGRQADLIVCNPPYVSVNEYLKIDASVRDFEPKLALIGGDDGLSFYKRLQSEAGRFLRPGGRLWLEIGSDQGQSINKIFNTSLWNKQTLIKDWSGRDRFFSLEK